MGILIHFAEMFSEDKLREGTSLILLLVCTITITLAGQPGTTSQCEDQIESKVVIDPNLSSDFFTSNETSYPWYILERDDGTFEDASDGVVSPDDLIKIEHTAKCISSHQGPHEMSFCDAKIVNNELQLEISGGLPAYASSLSISIDKDRNFKCSFHAVYPILTPGLRCRITKKTLKIKSDDFTAGSRLYAWISVEVEEGSPVNGEIIWKPYKIEGFLKPIIQGSRQEL